MFKLIMRLFKTVNNYLRIIEEVSYAGVKASSKLIESAEQFNESHRKKTDCEKIASTELPTDVNLHAIIDNFSPEDKLRLEIKKGILKQQINKGNFVLENNNREHDAAKLLASIVINRAVKYNKILNREMVLNTLATIGFDVYIPRCSSWKIVFIASNDSQSIYFLIGKRNIDFKLYNHVRKEKFDQNGKLFTDGGQLVRNYYNDSEVFIHKFILEIATLFITNTKIGKEYLVGNGTSPYQR
ncbi:MULTISPECIES: hypothetical protein [Vibrio harveyi group]|uniref:hypothetical protein n=1 Tax=Vibrio harveyi group TaxID=717610 RepID=UPI001BB0261F|nr:hypothetical protein [Vibrio parahaemolyticus]EKB1968989.1 hypothetical protein [Vibrio parahaemolyticus]QUD95014.1 hypothetical protein KBU60_17410 [Vibrio parahaemolyticus]